MHKIYVQFEIENKKLITEINRLFKDGPFFLHSYQVLIRVKVVICFWADTISHYHALAKDISYYKWYVRTFFFETATYIKNVITKNKKRFMGFLPKNNSLKYGSEEKGSSFCKCSILLGFFFTSKKLRGLWFYLLIKVQNETSLVFLT